MSDQHLLLLADFILICHALFVVFLVLGLILIVVGAFLNWKWIRNAWFRFVHLGGIAFVVVQTWRGEPCFLTVWEVALRSEAGAAAYEGSFIAYWLDYFLYYQAPAWVFLTLYTVFGLAVLLSWLFVPPRMR